TKHLYAGDLDVRFREESLGNLRLKDLNDFVKFVPSSQNMEYNSNIGSPMNLDLGASWLHDCANYHEHCCHQPQLESILPYRVLDLGISEIPQNMFLSVGEDRVGSYATLSYCWGKPGSQRNYLTTEENLELRQKAVDESTFPKTFTDAIVVCRHLGIRFLWIDSLCIVQGSKSDWQTQSGRMGDIYSNASLTISAAVGEDSNAGLFVERDPRKTYPCPLNVQYPKEDGVIEKGEFLMCHDWYTPEPAYLDKRGWTFQENYLSPRTLRFSPTGISWTCASKSASEGLPMGLNPSNNKSDFDRHIKMDAARSCSDQITMRQRFYWWYHTMEIYSHRIFTHETDRLIALSGLVAKVQISGDEFLYGLWKSDLARGLAWRITAQNEEDATDASLTSSIPSWSWASRPGKIITYAENEMEGRVMDGSYSILSECGGGNSLPVTFFELLHENPTPPATYLAPSFKPLSLKLRGLIQTIIPAKSCLAYTTKGIRAYKSFLLFKCAFSAKTQMRNEFLAHAFYDEPVTKGDNLYCLPLKLLHSSERKDAKTNAREPYEKFSIDELASLQTSLLSIGGNTPPEMTWCAGPASCRRMEKHDSLSCLILKKVDAGVKYRRVGYLELSKGHLFDGVSPTTLEII
ncbi:hypothetical protein LOCC1_G007171, partial [Lachnellula occidentalis]